MVTRNNFGVHEMLEVHELLSFKTVCMAKANSMVGLVQDTQLQSLLREDITNTKQVIKELEGILS